MSELIDKLLQQLSESMRHLSNAVDDVESASEDGSLISARTETLVERSAASVISCVGALRAVLEVEAELDDEEELDDDDDPPDSDR